MKKKQIVAQLYCFRDYVRTLEGFEDTLKKLAKMGYEAVQLSGPIVPMPEKDMVKLMKKYGLKMVSTHINGKEILENTDKVIDQLTKLGIKHIACPSPVFPMTGAGEAIAFAKKLNTAAKKMKKAGITLAYHNHAIEFLKFEGKTILDYIYDNAPDLDGEIDTLWVQRGGGCPCGWVKKLAGRMEVIHLKDSGMRTDDPQNIWGARQVMTPVGEGNLNWKGIIEAAEKGGVKYFAVEHDGDCPDPFASFKSSIDFLVKNFVK